MRRDWQPHGFQVRADDVAILCTPVEYYERLCRGIASARRRIVLSSLYFGTRLPAERKLLRLLARAAAAPDGPQVLVLLDALRSTRPMMNMGTASLDAEDASDERVRSRCTASTSSFSYADDLAASLLAHPSSSSSSLPPPWRCARVRVALFHTPLLPRLMGAHVPRRFDEVFGVQHAKCCVIDDDVIVSGANLSENYFTNRQDRYALFSRAPGLADAMHGFVESIASHAYELGPDARLRDVPAGVDPRKAPADFCASLRDSIAASMVAPGGGDGDGGVATGTGAGSFWMSSAPSPGHALVYPLAQAGFAGVTQETDAIVEYTRELASRQRPLQCTLASAYLNLSDAWRRALVDVVGARGRLRLLPSSAQAHGFGRASGIAGLLPYAYQLLQRDSLDSLRRHGVGDAVAGPDDAVELMEYARPGWEYHCKGIWLEDFTDAARSERVARMPFASVLGSSNYGARSAMRDVELQMLVRTEDAGLQIRLGSELAAIEAHAVPACASTTLSSVGGAPSPPLPRPTTRLFVRILLPLIRHLL